MINLLESWIGKIIVAIIISVIIEMILPECNNKKYINMILGLYVLFVIINPLLSIATDNNSNLLNFDYEKYFKNQTNIINDQKDYEEENSKLIKQTYIKNIKNDIVQKIEKVGYKVKDINLKIETDENNDKYGTINYLEISIDMNEVITENSIKIKTITIENNIDNTNIENKLSKDDKEKIINLIKEEYNIDDISKININ